MDTLGADVSFEATQSLILICKLQKIYKALISDFGLLHYLV